MPGDGGRISCCYCIGYNTNIHNYFIAYSLSLFFSTGVSLSIVVLAGEVMAGLVASSYKHDG